MVSLYTALIFGYFRLKNSIVDLQCCGSGMFYPGSGSDHCSIPDPDPGSRIRGVKKHWIPDPTYFCIKAINKFCLLIPVPDPTIAPPGPRILGVKKHRIPDPDPQHWLTSIKSAIFIFKNIFCTLLFC
jgi:hypothetical protein